MRGSYMATAPEPNIGHNYFPYNVQVQQIFYFFTSVGAGERERGAGLGQVIFFILVNKQFLIFENQDKSI